MLTPGAMHAFPHVVERGSSTRLRTSYRCFGFLLFLYHHFLISMLFIEMVLKPSVPFL